MTTRRSFDLFMSQLLGSNQTLDYFCDFDKIEENVDLLRLHLCMLNSLIGAANLRKAVSAIWRTDKTAFSALGILIAVRNIDNQKFVDCDGQCLTMGELIQTEEGVMEFLNGTGLADVLQQRRINNLVDYVFGIETGLDTNARKNRGGHLMEQIVARRLEDAGVDWQSEVYSSDWPELQDELGVDEKRFDFAIETQRKTYLIEVNFYNAGGSKLNEIARSYSELAPIVNSVRGFEFVWVTDGQGWFTAKNKLREAWTKIPRLYNLTTFADFLRQIKTSRSCR